MLRTQNIISADRILAAKRTSDILTAAIARTQMPGVGRGSAQNVDGDCVLAYWSSAMALCRGARHFSLAQDAVDCSARKNEITCVWVPERQRSFFAASQAIRNEMLTPLPCSAGRDPWRPSYHLGRLGLQGSRVVTMIRR
jgi:hypothetical protein